MPLGQPQGAWIEEEARVVDAGCPQAAGGVSAARPDINRVAKSVVGADADGLRSVSLKKQAAAVARMNLGIFRSLPSSP
jgi:hypothetical protein